MLAYAEGRQRIGARGSAPSTMLFIIGAHVAALAVAMSMKMVVDGPIRKPPIEIDLIKIKTPPPPPPTPQPQRPSKPTQSKLDRPPVIVPTPRSDAEIFDATRTPIVPIADLFGTATVIPQLHRHGRSSLSRSAQARASTRPNPRSNRPTHLQSWTGRRRRRCGSGCRSTSAAVSWRSNRSAPTTARSSRLRAGI